MHQNTVLHQAGHDPHQIQVNPNQLRNLRHQMQYIDVTNAIFKTQQEQATFPNNNNIIISQENLNISSSSKQFHQGISGQPICSFSGLHTQPDKPIDGNKLINIGNPGPSKPGPLNQLNQHTNQTNINPGLGPKFKPLEEVKRPQLVANVNNSMHLPKPTNAELSMLQNTESPIITLVGKGAQKKLNTANQQKKIFQFQMKTVSLNQDKMRQIKSIQHASQQIQPDVVNAFASQNPAEIGLETQNITTIQNPIGMKMPLEIHNPEDAQPPTGINFQDNVTGIQNITGIACQPHNPPNNLYTANNIPIQTALHRMQAYKSKIKEKTAVAKLPHPKSQEVETVFQVDNIRSFTPPINQKPTNPSTQHQPSNTVNIHSRRSKNYQVDPYAYNYPKGIPKSFLIQRQQGTASETGSSDGPIWPSYQINPPMVFQPILDTSATAQTVAETDEREGFPQPYSPSELYMDFEKSFDPDFEDPESPEPSPSGQKRLSAFQRLGPQTQPKKPKLTISVTVNDDQEVREVVDETEEVEEITPVHLREDIILSTDETVVKYLKAWPWKRNVIVKKSVTARNSKTVMMLEREQMEEIYNRDTLFIQVTVKGYPSSWSKEQVLDTLMDNIRGYSFIPCFIDFNLKECKFLTLRCRSALLSLHKCGFVVRKGDVELTVALAQTELTLNQLDFVPRLILRKILNKCTDKDSKLNLSAFTLKEDVSHFIYFPLNRLINQMEIIDMQSEVTWSYLTELNLSHNRIQSLDGLDLEQTSPKLKHLDLSYNYLEKITSLLKVRQLALKTIHLEGNPLCRNYIDPDQYVKAVKMMFSSINTIDGVAVRLKGEMPKFHRNYCPEDAKEVADKFLEVYFPLLDGDLERRQLLENMYESTANMTVTYNYKIAFTPIYRCFKTLFADARNLKQGKMDIIKGSKAIAKTISNWPLMEHDPLTFTVDVIYHSDATTIIRIDGILKLTRESLAEDEYLVAFSRTVVLHSKDATEYKIQAETLCWSTPVGSYARSAFSVTTVKSKQIYPKIESTTDEKLQGELLNIFMKLTTMDKKISERCLELKKWNLREALDHFTKLLKLDGLESLTKEVS